MSVRIDDLVAWQALDSRGTPTVACRVALADGTNSVAIAPSGASTGQYEARELRDGGARFAGLGVDAAVEQVRSRLLPALRGTDVTDQLAVDATIRAVDGTPALTTVGGNTAVAVSLACFLAAAAATERAPWQHAAELAGADPVLPLPMVNIVSGGAHADHRIDLQDILAVPVAARDFREALAMVWEVRRAASLLAAKRGLAPALVADEGGIAPAMVRNEDALALVCEAIETAGLRAGPDVGLAIDVAANQLRSGEDYRLALEDRRLASRELLGYLAELTGRFPIVSVEDPLHDDDWPGWATAASGLPGRQLLADDLVATQPDRVDRALDIGVNAVLIKVNQAGTVSDALHVLQAAQRRGAATVVSARSGDTEQFWLADLATGWGAGQLKVGSTHRSERTAKWNRLLELATSHPELPYAGPSSLAAWPNPSEGKHAAS